MTKTLKNHASLRGVSNANDAARLARASRECRTQCKLVFCELSKTSRFHIRTEEWQDCTFNLLSQLRERQLALSTCVTLSSCMRYAFTMADRLSRTHTLDPSKTLAFTMAEILLSLTIIGVVAAITLPSLMANINERTWNTQRKALYARMSQAIAMMPQVGGYGTLTEAESGRVTADTAAETFLTEGLSKVLKINNICDNEHLQDCGVPTSYVNLVGSTMSWPKNLDEMNDKFVGFSLNISGSNWSQTYSYSQANVKSAAFETLGGETVALYYNPYCTDNEKIDYVRYSQSQMCANFIYDLNGNKGPNTVGKDIGFITALYSSDTNVVSPMPLATRANAVTQYEASSACTALSPDVRVANIDELMAVFYNQNLTGTYIGGNSWSSSVLSTEKALHMSFSTGERYAELRTISLGVLCVKR